MIRLVTGGQRSGKSSFAEGLLKDKENVAYIATANVDGEEMEERVKRHKETRPETWSTYECYKDFLSHIGDEDYLLLECLGTMTSNIMYEKTKDLERIAPELAKEIEDEVYKNVKELITYVRGRDKDLTIITNEVGLSLTPMDHISRVYTDCLGRISQRVAKLCDEVYLVVCGIEMKLK
ncbi:bifunctional adenosylcobinamide kinase/adenosylcobinamide-phosphate guanylyltransferase [Neofamilia massiliensis]|uniref:bifunctional adenosylcobinamide kinase/adenosylcobinamide-phosphate guanylyltransferase n=1 Tax=Neofamilia massiliensis TaxID=1673724 RepID=UPI0006BB8CC9|nr:bifunctional adenosylcobinamide kinase/adenosylcobinamide-phosphate guanylyltransferase [Neofamilia massiliensis]